MSIQAPPHYLTKNRNVPHLRRKQADYIASSETYQSNVLSPSIPLISSILSAAIDTNLYTSIGPDAQTSRSNDEYKNASAIEIFISHAALPSEEPLRQSLENSFNALRRQNWRLIRNWGQATIPRECEKSNYLATAHLILLIVNNEFLATDFCYSQQMKAAVKKHEQDKSYVLPIIASSVSIPLLEGTPFGHLKRLPGDGKPVNNRRTAFAEITTNILDIFYKRRFF